MIDLNNAAGEAANGDPRPETIADLKARVDLVEIAGRYTTLEQRQGRDQWGCCPIHGERTPSFKVRTEDCFHERERHLPSPNYSPGLAVRRGMAVMVAAGEPTWHLTSPRLVNNPG